MPFSRKSPVAVAEGLALWARLARPLLPVSGRPVVYLKRVQLCSEKCPLSHERYDNSTCRIEQDRPVSEFGVRNSGLEFKCAGRQPGRGAGTAGGLGTWLANPQSGCR